MGGDGASHHHGRKGEYPEGMKTQERIGSSFAANHRKQVVRIPDHAQSPEGAFFPPYTMARRELSLAPPRRSSRMTLWYSPGGFLGTLQMD
jgi:hypothetical protein